jgi:uncharacterized membrane protein YsdA (DUF1294 family)
MNTPLAYIPLAFFAIINVVAFAVMAIDKHRSIQSRDVDRIPEGILFFIATLFGSVGIYLAMHLLCHKTRKWYFQIGIPLLIAQQLVLVYIGSMFLLTPIY